MLFRIDGGGSVKILQINTFGNLSTGKISVDIARTLKSFGHECIVAYARNALAEDVKGIKIGSKLDVYLHGVLTRITDRAGFYSKKATKKLIQKIDEMNPDIIQLHNIHGYYINIELLFQYIDRKKIPVVWTLHDCWAFTGHCAHFETVQCYKWRTQCYNCQLKCEYPRSFICDNSKRNYQQKKELFTSLDNMTLVVPSNWLLNYVKQSFLAKYPVRVINNGIDHQVFKPTLGNWKKENRLENKKVILGVAGTWSSIKGLDDMVQLADLLDETYQVVVIGVSKIQKKGLPEKVIGIERIYNSNKLAEIYSGAEFFVNPTYADNFPTVNLEALSCGTPVITYKTGGSPEIIDETCGYVVDQGDISAVSNAIKTLHFMAEKCIERSKLFDSQNCFKKYVDTYQEVLYRGVSKC